MTFYMTYPRPTWRYVHLQYIISFYDGWVPVVGHVRTGYDRSDGPKAQDRDHFVHGTIHWAGVQCRRPHTYNTPTFNELLRDLSKPSVTAIYDMYTFNTYTRYIKDQCDYANPNMIRQPFTEFIRGISRANMTAMYEMQTFNTYSRYIQDQRDWHMPYTMRQPFNELLRGISSPMWLPYTLQWASTRYIQFNVTTTTLQWASRRYIQPNVTAIYTSMSFYEVYPVQRDYANPSMSFYEVYPALGQPKYDPPTLHWVCTRYMQGQRDCHIDQQTFNTYTRYIQDQRDYANPSMSFYKTYPRPTWLP